MKVICMRMLVASCLLVCFSWAAEANDFADGKLPNFTEPYAQLIGNLEAIRMHNLEVGDYHSPKYIQSHVFELAVFKRLNQEQKIKYLTYKLARSRYDGEKAFFLSNLIEAYAKQYPNVKLVDVLKKTDRNWLKGYCISIQGSEKQFDENIRSFLR